MGIARVREHGRDARWPSLVCAAPVVA